MLLNFFTFPLRQPARKEQSTYQNNKSNRSNETPYKIVIYMEPATIMEKREWKQNNCISTSIQ